MKQIYKNIKIKIILALLAACIFPVFPTQAQEAVSESAGKEYFQIIEEAKRYVSDLLSALGNDSEAYNLPFGIKKTMGASTYTLAISNVKIGKEFGEITMYLRITDLYKGKELIFGVAGLKISYTGDLIGDINLALLNDVPLPLGNVGEVILKGSMNSSGASTSGTVLQLDCNGDFKQLSLDGELILNKNTFKLAGTQNKEVRASFRSVIADITDLFLELSVPNFELYSIPGFEFSLSNVALDMSDIRNPTAFMPNEEYFSTRFTLPDRNLWRGVYAENVTLTFPSMFDKKGSGEKSQLSASHFLIDENGVTGDIAGTNVLPLEMGNASGCPFSVTDFKLGFIANNINKFGFAGEVGLPMAENLPPRHYEAFISKDEYLFNVSLGENLDFNLFGAGKLYLQPTSYLQIEVRNGKFMPKVVLDGEMELAVGGLVIEQLVFTKLSLATQSPIFSVESVKCGGNLALNHFPISISNFNFSSADNAAALGFDLKINLMQGAISADSGIKLRSDYHDGNWHFKGVEIDKLLLRNVQLAGFSLAGEILLVKDDPDYGEFFGGDITATFGALSNALTVNVKSMFGHKDFRYWYVEGSANFSYGIPIGPVSLNGFKGGAYYHVSPSGGQGVRTYVPNEQYSLGVKAGVSFHVGSKGAVNGDALFEMNFLSTGGIGNIKFYGNAKFMDASALLGNGFESIFNSVMSNIKDLGESVAANIPGNLDGSDATKLIIPNLDMTGAVTASVMMQYDFTTKTFDANFKVNVNVGGILTGAGNGGEAGWAHLYCSPQKWYIHAGTPSNPLGLRLGLGSLSLSTESYFMLGDELEKPIIDPNVANLLHITSQDADYMKYPENMSLGKGLAFGSRFKFDTGNLNFLILYANFKAGTGFDVMLSDMSGYSCAGRSEPIGINGWYANGQVYAYLDGELGVRIKILSIKKNITIIKGGAAALLQAKLPSPTWIGGYMAIDLNVLGIIKANMKMKFSFGDDCQLVRNDGDYSPLDFPVIADLTPTDKDTEVDVFISPQATFNMGLDEAFTAQDDEGNTHTYRIHLADFYVTDNKGQRMTGTIKQKKNTVASFESFEILPPNVEMKATVIVNFEENTGGGWQLVAQNGQTAKESKAVGFTTGGAPNYIPVSNIDYCYPVIDQKNFFKGETNEAYVQLKKGQSYLFPSNFDYKASFAVSGGQSKDVDFSYNVSEKKLTCAFPALSNRTGYELSFAAYSRENSQSGDPGIKQTSTTITDQEGEAFTLDYMQQAAQKILKEGSMKVLDYTFRSSGYNTFEQKMAALSLSRGAISPGSEIFLLFLGVSGAYELFDEVDLNGSAYSGGKSLISAEAIVDDTYYNNDIAPLTYNLLSVSGMSIQNRDISLLGAPPVRAFYTRDGYFSGDESITKSFPLVYQLPLYYNTDYYELRNKAANLLANGANLPVLLPLLTSQFPIVRKGDYKTQLRYVLPGDKQGTSKQINYNWW
ncbi:MAG: hypothetical protein LBU22_07455 [Dysgonamonadaceae bacterium]|jgi:hypothetical protein|nr:hypothetical protein [Dysgonamonadaceae bacterium]